MKQPPLDQAAYLTRRRLHVIARYTFDLMTAEFGHDQAKRAFLGIAKARPKSSLPLVITPKEEIPKKPGVVRRGPYGETWIDNPSTEPPTKEPT